MVAKALASITGFIVGLTVGSVGQFAAAQIGEGPLSLDPVVVEGYERFKRTPNRYFFAISEDGNTYSYTFCESDFCKVTRRRTHAIYLCEKSAKMRCFIYANRDRVVWDGKITVRGEPMPATTPPEVTRKVLCDVPGEGQQILIYSSCLYHDGEVLGDAP